MDQTAFTIDTLENLIKLAPTKEEKMDLHMFLKVIAPVTSSALCCRRWLGLGLCRACSLPNETQTKFSVVRYLLAQLSM